MPAVTTAYVKNIIRRGFSELVDPSPRKDHQALIWKHFDSKCAFCDRVLTPAAEEGRMDHLLAASQKGANAIGNRVLSCGPCNDKEKLDQPWEVFLRAKSESDEVFEIRREKIRSWQLLHPVPDEDHHRALNAAAAAKAAEVISLFDKKVSELQQMMTECNLPPK